MLFSFIRIYLRAFSVSGTGLSTKDTSQYKLMSWKYYKSRVMFTYLTTHELQSYTIKSEASKQQILLDQFIPAECSQDLILLGFITWSLFRFFSFWLFPWFIFGHIVISGPLDLHYNFLPLTITWPFNLYFSYGVCFSCLFKGKPYHSF